MTMHLRSLLPVLLLSSCSVGPNFKLPEVLMPSKWKNSSQVNTTDIPVPGEWWKLFKSEELNKLEERALQNNLQLRSALARVETARALVGVQQASWFPYLNMRDAMQYERLSASSFGANLPAGVPLPKTQRRRFQNLLDEGWEIDLWGRVRRGFESSRADVQAQLATYYNVLLTLEADVAQNYFALRSLDAEIATVDATVDLRHEQVKLVRSRFEGGIGSDLAVAQAETELATTEADQAALAQQRDQLENAIAILVGENPASYRLAALTAPNWNPAPPVIPAGLPSDLLERRPDVAAAERQLASANAKIGVAKAAFFPVLSLTGSGGYLSGDVDSLFNWSSRTWSLGPSLSLPIFAGGRNRANYQRAQSARAETAGLYRQQVLVAFGEVQNSLSDIRHLADQSAAQTRAVTNARRAAELATERYRAGIVSYIEVVDANREALANERANAQLAGRRLVASVQLVKALGGGWTGQQLVAATSVAESQPEKHK